MNSPATLQRPTLSEALNTWKIILAERGFATDILWIFEENLCFENSRAERGGFGIPDEGHFLTYRLRITRTHGGHSCWLAASN